MTAVAHAAPQATRYMQGIAVPAESVRPMEFFARTRREILPEASRNWAGPGGTDTVTLKKAGIIAGVFVRLTGNVVVTLGTGTATPTARWPYDLAKKVRFTANGEANLINVSGLKLKVRELMDRQSNSDRGVAQSFNGTTKTQGTLSLAAESWGVGPGAAAVSGTFPVELVWFVPVAEDQVELAGAIFAATTSTDLEINIDWEAIANLFAITGNATVAFDATTKVTVQSIKYRIPTGADGQIVVPDLSVFHGLVQSSNSAIASGANEVALVGQGAGKTLLRVFSQFWNNGSPVVVNDSNLGELGWTYGSNTTPDRVAAGLLREINERAYNCDIGALWGFWCHDFAYENAFRDTLDLGTASEMRQLINIPSGLALTNPKIEYVSETISSAATGG